MITEQITLLPRQRTLRKRKIERNPRKKGVIQTAKIVKCNNLGKEKKIEKKITKERLKKIHTKKDRKTFQRKISTRKKNRKGSIRKNDLYINFNLFFLNHLSNN